MGHHPTRRRRHHDRRRGVTGVLSVHADLSGHSRAITAILRQVFRPRQDRRAESHAIRSCAAPIISQPEDYPVVVLTEEESSESSHSSPNPPVIIVIQRRKRRLSWSVGSRSPPWFSTPAALVAIATDSH